MIVLQGRRLPNFDIRMVYKFGKKSKPDGDLTNRHPAVCSGLLLSAPKADSFFC
jgi:hypothetical protein